MTHRPLTVIMLALLALSARGQITINGTGPTYATIQAAIDAAASGDTVSIPSGNHQENLFILFKHITLEGASSLTTTIDAGGNDRVLVVRQSGSGTTTIRDLAIVNGRAPGPPLASGNHAGGGIRAFSLSSSTSWTLRVEDCRFTGNVGNSGAALFTEGGVKLELFDSVLSGNGRDLNSATPFGAVGGAVSTLAGAHIKGCQFSGNSCAGPTTLPSQDGIGGAIYIGVEQAPTLIEDCSFIGNSANFGSAIGGAPRDDIVIHSCLIASNHAAVSGGSAIHYLASLVSTSAPPPGRLEITNCLLHGNTHPQTPGTVVFTDGGDLEILNSTITGNGGPGAPSSAITMQGYSLQASSDLVVRNSIIQGNFDDRVRVIDAATVTLTHSLLAGGLTIGGAAPSTVVDLGGLAGLDPAFVDPAGGDFGLRPGSPCVDAASPALGVPATDLNGAPRFVGANVDVGCFELQNQDPGPAFTGTVGSGDVLFFNGQTGGITRSIAVDAGSICTILVNEPLPFTPAPFIIWGYLGVPPSGDAFPIPFAGGSMAFAPHLSDIGNPMLFTFTNNILAPASGIVQSTAAPWVAAGPCAPFPITMTLQGLIAEGSGPLRITNAIVLHAR